MSVAAEHGQLDVVRFLIDEGATLEPTQPMLPSAYRMAAREGQLEVLRFLIERGASPESRAAALAEAAFWGRLEAVRLLLQHAHTLTEGAGAAPLAAVLTRKDDLAGRNVGLVISGGNLSYEQLQQIVGSSN